MARSDLLLNLASAGTRGDKFLLRRTIEAMVAEERAKQHHVLADRLSEILTTAGNGSTKVNLGMDEGVGNMLTEITPVRKLEDLFLPSMVRVACDELVEEHHRKDLLRSYNLEPRNRALLVGPPGNGKTSLAEALAEALVLPLYVVRYEGIIGSYLGETAARMSRMFEFVCGRQCVLFLDEFDTIAKERGDAHETGEIKRVVSSLLLKIDALPSHVLVVTATNHPELLDRAVWRRFQLRLKLPMPTRALREEWFKRFSERFDESIGYSPRTLADHLGTVSFAELEEFSTDVMRRLILSKPDGKLVDIVRQRLELWKMQVKPIQVVEED